MPRTDPSRSSDSATRHLFRHFFDEQELLRNPYVGSALAAGRVTMSELQMRLADAARSIEKEDRASGNHRRGARQAIALVECTLKRRPAAEVASEIGLSTRQLFRERQAAWIRAVRYLTAAEPGGPPEPLFADVQCNYAAQLFASGQPEAGDVLLRQIMTEATGFEAFMLAALGAELHHHAGHRASAVGLLAVARSSYSAAALKASPICRLTMMLLDELLEMRMESSPKVRLNADMADLVVLDRGVRWWMVRLATRLLIEKYRRAVASYDRRGALRTAEAAVALGQRVPNLQGSEEFNLRLLTARVDWIERGWTPRAEVALIENYLTASANGWLSKAAHVASLLASMMTVARKTGAQSYARVALAAANTLPEGETARFVYLNLAVAELDAGRPEEAAVLLTNATAATITKGSAFDTGIDESQAEYALLAREVRAATLSAHAAPVPFGIRRKIAALTLIDPLRAAYCSRVAAMELERRDDHRAATRLIAEAWEIAAHDGDWMSLRTIGRTYRHLTQRPPRSDSSA
jgi:hypothetical protein